VKKLLKKLLVIAVQSQGEEAQLQRPLAATKPGASGRVERAWMNPFGSCMCEATWRQPRAAAAGRTAENSHVF